MTDFSFQSKHLSSNLARSSLQGGIAAIAAQGIRFVLHIGSIMVLARLLAPEDYGMFSIVMSFVVLGNLFKDLGLPTATIQCADISHAQVSTLFWINVFLGCVLAVLAVIAAPVIAWFFREPRLAWMMATMGSVFIMNGVLSQPQALLSRRMQFIDLAVIDVSAMFMGVSVGIISAWKFSAGYWALIWIQMIMVCVTMIGVFVACRWRPDLPSRNSGIHGMLKFGSRVTVMSIFAHLGRSLDNLVIGWYWGIRELSFYDKAYQMMMLPIYQISGPISGIALPVLSSLQKNPKSYQEYFFRIIVISGALGMMLASFLYVVADQAVLVILGPQWTDSVPIFRALSPAAFIDTLMASFFWVPLSLGQGTRLMRAMAIISVISIFSFFIGLPWGAVGVATAYSVSRYLVLLPILIYCCHESPVKWRFVFNVIWRPAAASITAAFGMSLIIDYNLFHVIPLIDLIINALVYIFFFLLVWILLPNGLRFFIETIHILRQERKESTDCSRTRCE